MRSSRSYVALGTAELAQVVPVAKMRLPDGHEEFRVAEELEDYFAELKNAMQNRGRRRGEEKRQRSAEAAKDLSGLLRRRRRRRLLFLLPVSRWSRRWSPAL